MSISSMSFVRSLRASTRINITLRSLSTTRPNLVNTYDPADRANVPQSAKEATPHDVEKSQSNNINNTDSAKNAGRVSHATGDSVVPEAVQKIVPESVEKALPDAVHDTSKKA